MGVRLRAFDAAVDTTVNEILEVAGRPPVAPGGGSPEAGARWWALALGADLAATRPRSGRRGRRRDRHRGAHRPPHLVLAAHPHGAVVAVVTIAIAWPCLWPHYLVSG